MTTHNQKSDTVQPADEYRLRDRLSLWAGYLLFAVVNGFVTLAIFLWFFSRLEGLDVPIS